MSGQGHVTTGQLRSSQVMLRSVRTGQVKSRSGQVRSDPVTLMTWSHRGHVRSGQGQGQDWSGQVGSGRVMSRLGQGRVKSDHIKIRSCQVISGSDQ